MAESSTPALSPLRVGITGNMGSGKTTVCHIFETLGIPVYAADARAKWLLQHDPDLKKGIVQIFGNEAYLPDSTYNRPFIAQVAFADPEKLAALNALVHPAVDADSALWHLQQSERGAPYTLREAALLIESGNHRRLHALIVVTAPEDLRIQRVMQRDGLRREQILARLAAQMPEAEKVELANYVVVNDGRQLLLPQVMAIHRQLQRQETRKNNTS